MSLLITSEEDDPAANGMIKTINALLYRVIMMTITVFL